MSNKSTLPIKPLIEEYRKKQIVLDDLKELDKEKAKNARFDRFCQKTKKEMKENV